jgi:hypothetical protein
VSPNTFSPPRAKSVEKKGVFREITRIFIFLHRKKGKCFGPAVKEEEKNL